MMFRALQSYAGIVSLALLIGACGGGGGGGGQQPPPPPPPPPPVNQTIAFATAGTISSRAGTTVTNVASGGAGTGAITYASSDTAVATVNSTSGVATLLAPGTTTITATKAASTGFNAASATYQLTATVETQTIAFTLAGPVTGPLGAMMANAASGGAGTGAITYASNNTNIATVEEVSGVVTLVGAGTVTITATKAASIGYSTATATYDLQVAKGNQQIAFAIPGTRNVLLSSTSDNAASGGAGTGAITYASNNTSAATVNTTTGAVTAVGLGTAVIAATKAADANYNAALAQYIVQVQSAGSVHAWVGSQASEVFLPATALGKSFDSASIAACGVVTNNLSTCANVLSLPVTGAPISTIRSTLTTPAYFAISDGATSGVPIVANTKRFSERILHGAVFFKNRYWVIGGARPDLPGFAAPSTVHVPQSDVWSSSDARTWKLETANAAFGPRWLHQTLVYNNEIWILGGSKQSSGVGTREVWHSADGVNWTLASTNLPPMTWTPSVAATVFSGAMWVVVNGQSWSSVDGITWTARSAVAAIDTGEPREYASLTVYNNKLWYIGGARVVQVNPAPPVFERFAQSDIWSSSDGIAWTFVASNKFEARQQHAAFVLNNRLWIFGGQSVAGGTPGPPPKNAWSTSDGVSWTQEAQGTQIDFSWLMGTVQETNRVTLIGGVLRSYSNQVWTTTNGNNWTELAPFEFAPNLLSRGAVFKDAMWVIGGGRMDGADTDEIWRSSDGLTWSRVNTSGQIFSPRDSQRVLVFNNRLWVIGGWDFFSADGGTETFNNEVWSSADGVTWTQHLPTGAIFSARAGHEAVVFNGRMWVVGGTDGVQLYNDIWSSADGATWVREQEHAAFSPRYTHSLVVHNNMMWLLAGSESPPVNVPHVGLADAWQSSDGRSWTQLAPPPFAARMEAAATVFNGRIFLVAGFSSDNYFGTTRYRDVWSTADGNSWQQETPEAFSGRNSPILLDYKGRLHVIGGFSIARPHDVWRSTDGIEWSAAFSHPISAP